MNNHISTNSDDAYIQLLASANSTLSKKYQALPQNLQKSKVTCIKVNITYNLINATLYYDEFQQTKNMILKLEYNNQVYLGDIHLGKFIQDLNKEPALCHQLLQGGKLKPFYTRLEQKISNGPLYVINFEKDTEFLAAVTLWRRNHLSHGSKTNHAHIFLKTFRRDSMSPKMFQSLIKDNKISFKVVKAIKNSGYTVVRTDEPWKRNSLVALLQQYNIMI